MFLTNKMDVAGLNEAMASSGKGMPEASRIILAVLLGGGVTELDERKSGGI